MNGIFQQICLFFQYLKIISAYRSLLQTVNKHPVVIILATGYVESWRLFRHYSSGKNYLTYWKDHELHILRFVLKVIPDAHICPLDFLSYQMQFFSTISQLQIYMQKTCLQISHFASQCAYHHLSYCSCYQLSHYELQCKILQNYAIRSLSSSNYNESKSLVPKSKPNSGSAVCMALPLSFLFLFLLELIFCFCTEIFVSLVSCQNSLVRNFGSTF